MSIASLSRIDGVPIATTAFYCCRVAIAEVTISMSWRAIQVTMMKYMTAAASAEFHSTTQYERREVTFASS